jgi:hypothetical protein
MNGTAPVTWIFMLFLVLAVFGALAAIIWRSWVAGAIILVFIVAVFGLYFVRFVPSVAPPMIGVQETATPATVQLEPDSELFKTADLYPSMEEGFKNVAQRLCDNIQFKDPTVSPQHIHIVTVKVDNNTEFVNEIFRERFPQATVTADEIHKSDPGDLMVTLSVTDSGKTKCLKFTAKLDRRDFPFAEACVKDAPWVANFDEYRNAHSKDELIVGWSPLPQPTEELARQQARQEAARQMLPFATAKFLDLQAPNTDPAWLRGQLERELARRRFVKDEFVQRLHLPASGQTVYRVGVLVDASPAQLEKLRGTVIADTHRSSTHVRRFGGGVVGMGVLICLVYLFLNWATRGYFQMNLRLGAFLMLIAGVLLLLVVS